MRKTAIILAIIMCIGIFTACVADKTDETTTTTTTTTTSTEATSADVTESTTLAPTVNSSAYNTSITLKEALEALSDKYSDYTVRATVVEDDIQYFSIDNKESGEKYASVAVDMSTAEATETIMETQEKSTFNLNG